MRVRLAVPAAFGNLGCFCQNHLFLVDFHKGEPDRFGIFQNNVLQDFENGTRANLDFFQNYFSRDFEKWDLDIFKNLKFPKFQDPLIQDELIVS